MKQPSILFLQAVLVLIAVAAIVLMIRLPLTEGRAENLNLLRIYLDPLILYVYASSIAFFTALYKAFRLLGYIGQNNVFSLMSAQALRSIKYCATVLGVLIALAALFIRIFHHQDDDPAGFLALCMLAIFVTVVAAAAVTVFEKIVRNGIDLKAANEQQQTR